MQDMLAKVFKTRSLVATLILLLVLAFTPGVNQFIISPALQVVASDFGDSECTEERVIHAVEFGDIRVRFAKDAGKVTATVEGGIDCAFPVTMVVYKMYQAGKLSSQKFFSQSQTATIGNTATTKLESDLPPCMAQIDLYYGSNPPRVLTDDAASYAHMLLGYTYYLNASNSFETASGPFCSDTPLVKPTVSIVKEAPATTRAGDTIDFKLVVTNTGTVDAPNGFYLTDRLDTLLDFVRASSADCTFAVGPHEVVCSRAGKFSVGQSISYTLTFKVKPSVACNANIPNKADVSVPDGQGGHTNSWSNMTSTLVTCTPPPPVKQCKLEIRKSVSQSTAVPYNELEYVIDVKNIGTADCTGSGVRIQDVVDRGLTYVRESHSSNLVGGYETDPVYKEAARLLQWNAGTLIPGQTGHISWIGKVNNIAQCTEINIPNTARVTAIELDNFATWVTSNTVNTKVTGNCPPPTVVCTPGSQVVKINQVANVTATGGNGNFAWSAIGGNPATGNGAVFSTKYASKGDKTIRVTSGGAEATCNVTVVEDVLPQLVCAPGTQTIVINQTANFTASGGNGVFNWSASGASAVSGSGSSFATTYATAGGKVVMVTSGSQSATCSVTVTSPPTSPSLFCSPLSQNVNLGQTVNLTASGGNGSYTWYAPEGNLSANTGNSVNVSYASTGTKTVTVSSGGLTASCVLTITQSSGGVSSLSLTKSVRNVTQGTTFLKNLSNVRSGDTLEYQIRVRNTGSNSLSGFQVRDVISQSGYLQNYRNLTVSRGFSGDMYGSGMTVSGNLHAGEEFTIGYLYTATAAMVNNVNVCNTITISANGVGTVTDAACVFGSGSVAGVSVLLAKSAWNDTKNVNATSQAASREDYITYSLTVRNTGGTDAINYVITDDLSGVLPLADITDLGGGSLNGQTITYPALTIPVGGVVTKNFRVRVKYSLATNISYQMVNTFGNTVTIVINTPQTYTPPKTGGNTNALAGIGFAGLLTSGFLFMRKRNLARIIFS